MNFSWIRLCMSLAAADFCGLKTGLCCSVVVAFVVNRRESEVQGVVDEVEGVRPFDAPDILDLAALLRSAQLRCGIETVNREVSVVSTY